MSTRRRQSAGRVPDPSGNGFLCSCGCGRKPKPPRRTWFSEECVHAWKIKNDCGGDFEAEENERNLNDESTRGLHG